ncbi:SGNH/GDSL hydrolase family protein [Bacillus wiedmannii]|uniref:SGNH hydrolase-type esterase domain-containing protein n=1 Tax=Bacillus wiedmannii TaxID=1890302 RepID=A0A2A8BSZ1_9BACI|nr:SGNH/GDSL hydrolase family protein [Bacillus wiedmannii]PEM57651.1 hypothetical protein CN611_07520 [Bacillus wiedmannii]
MAIKETNFTLDLTREGKYPVVKFRLNDNKVQKVTFRLTNDGRDVDLEKELGDQFKPVFECIFRDKTFKRDENRENWEIKREGNIYIFTYYLTKEVINKSGIACYYFALENPDGLRISTPTLKMGIDCDFKEEGGPSEHYISEFEYLVKKVREIIESAGEDFDKLITSLEQLSDIEWRVDNLSTKVDYIDTRKIRSSQLDISSESARIQPQNLSEAVLKMMTGDTPVGEFIANGAVTNEKIANGAVSNSKIADGSVNGSKITKYAVGTDNVATEAITNPKIAPGSVTASKVAMESINYTKLTKTTRGIGINTGTLYPLRAADILNNALPDPTPKDEHQNVILSVRITGAKQNKIYAVETVYDGFVVGEKARYGVSFGQFDRQNDGKVDATTYKQVLSITDIPDSTVAITDSIITKVYDVPNFKLKIVVTYNRDAMGSYKGSRLSYIAGNNYFGCVLHPDSYNFADNNGIDEINILGDSLSANTQHASKPYHSHVGNWLGAKINNYGISGSTVGSKYDPMSIRYTGMSDTAKVTLVYGGTNDFGRNQPLGTMADRTNETFYGAMHVLLKGLSEKYAGKKIGFVSMHHFGTDFFKETNEFGLTKLDYVKATREVCEYYSIPLLDLYASGGFNFDIDAQKTMYSVDSLHFNNLGHERLAKLIYEFIMRL